MIEIKPNIQYKSQCPNCGKNLEATGILWQGIHTCIEAKCHHCQSEIIEDFPIGHGIYYPYQVDLKKSLIFGDKNSQDWLGLPFLESLKNPQLEKLEISLEVFKKCQKVVILNCLDFLYGHSLLKLLNAQKHLENYPTIGLIVIIQKFLRWMVPDGVAEIWTVDLPLKKARSYYPYLNKFISQQFPRFDTIYLSLAHSHPNQVDISKFTKIPKYIFTEQKEYKICFIWRQDRLLLNQFLYRIMKKLALSNWAIILQNRQVCRLFDRIKQKIPQAKFSVAGLGKKTQFPSWIEDLRVDKFDEKTEKKLCQIYSESILVIGVHGSNMLLPSGHAGMTIDLMPEDRWGNLAQDILYQEQDPRIAAFRYRYLPITTRITELAKIISSTILKQSHFYRNMTSDKLCSKHQ
ncbi:MAG: hypothetical protein AB4080_22390 [Trichodesmium sp.]